MDSVDRMEMILSIGILVISVLFYVVLGIIFLVIASKKKQTDPKDAKNWRILGIICMCISGFALIATMIAFLIPAILIDMSMSAVFIM